MARSAINVNVRFRFAPDVGTAITRTLTPSPGSNVESGKMTSPALTGFAAGGAAGSFLGASVLESTVACVSAPAGR